MSLYCGMGAAAMMMMEEWEEDQVELFEKRRRVNDAFDNDDLKVSTIAAIGMGVQLCQPERQFVMPERRTEFVREWGGEECDNFFRFTHFTLEELYRLHAAFELPAVIRVGKQRFDSFDLVVLSLLRMADVSTLDRMASWLGWYDTEISNALSFLSDYVFGRSAHDCTVCVAC